MVPKVVRTGVAAAAMFILGCESPTAIEKDVRVTVNDAILTAQERFVELDATVRNEGSQRIKLVGCGTEKLERATGDGDYVVVTRQLECAAAGLPDDGYIEPQSEAVFHLVIPVVQGIQTDASYRLSIPVFIEGRRDSRLVKSSNFTLSASH
ncbi:MAG TPA: hypothetical protein VF042_01900 [Gemmatimonadaceae bacterium]